ncbi:proline-rich nuclear receptor coactivator 2 A-like [Rhynchophorus ferrugineus]|uniref:Proline-rich nuclear receptor coactivator 2 n=1 Tax=Rhynchophorus ferrugineus TaxID=354439 RepID=A0A834M6Q0_RHYFE|nr:hypothetical protein GWI33_013375 [Rhynchophorus ferrugineus]
MAMTKRSDIGGKIVSQAKAKATKYPSKPTPQDSPVHNKSPRQSPVRGTESSRRSPLGVLAGHYAGCKFTEPPSASAVPLPPLHWMQAKKSVMLPFNAATSVPSAMNQHLDFTQQLKLLLKVQA